MVYVPCCCDGLVRWCSHVVEEVSLMSTIRRTLVVTRIADNAQIRVIKEFAEHVLWDEEDTRVSKALSIDTLQLTSSERFWAAHIDSRIMACGHKQAPGAKFCTVCARAGKVKGKNPYTPPCKKGRKNHSWSKVKDGIRTCALCRVRAIYNQQTLRVMRYET